MFVLKFIISSKEFVGETSSIYMKPGDRQHLYTEDGKLAYEQTDRLMPSPAEMLSLIQHHVDLESERSGRDHTIPQIVVVINPSTIRVFGGNDE